MPTVLCRSHWNEYANILCKSQKRRIKEKNEIIFKALNSQKPRNKSYVALHIYEVISEFLISERFSNNSYKDKYLEKNSVLCCPQNLYKK